MIWDDIRKAVPMFRDPTVQVVRVPFRLSANEGEFLHFGVDSNKIAALLPKNTSGRIDATWLRPPFASFVIASARDEDPMCLFVTSRAEDDGTFCMVWTFLMAAGMAKPYLMSTWGLYLHDEVRLPAFSVDRVVADTMNVAIGLKIPWATENDPIAGFTGEHLRTLAEGVGQSVTATLALMSCKNIKREERHPPRQQRRRAERDGLPLVSWHELVLDGSAGAGGGAAGTGESVALHWVRGHFKDYREHGVFGRSKGVYWWSPHLAGAADRVVLKDYVVSE